MAKSGQLPITDFIMHIKLVWIKLIMHIKLVSALATSKNNLQGSEWNPQGTKKKTDLPWYGEGP
jgi:hypothetical protein